MTYSKGIVLELGLFDLQRGKLMCKTSMIFFFYITSLLIKVRHVLSFKRQIIFLKKRCCLSGLKKPSLKQEYIIW